METIALPETVTNLRRHFDDQDIKNILQTSQNTKNFSDKQNTIWKYAGSALLAGRPMDSAVIFMAGSSGSGKSSTVNVLFDDPHLCKTSSSKSETKKPTLVQKKLNVPLEKTHPISGFLRFVDVPGSFDTEGGQDAQNIAYIERFKNSIPSLQVRELPSDVTRNGVRDKVFPNLVLFIAKATDNFEGDGLRKTLEVLDQFTNVVDKEHPNVVVALSHCMSLAHNKQKFEEKLKAATTKIQEVFKSVLQIEGVEVVPVENLPTDHDLKQEGDFFKLPNNELSHFNLFQAMLRRLEMNKDILGQLFVGHYFGTECPEKDARAKVIVPEILMSPEDLSLAQLNLQDRNLSVPTDNPAEIYQFEKLGYGYCPVNEKTKFTSLLGAQGAMSMKIIDLNGNKFRIPSCVNATIRNKSRFHCISFFAKEEYQNHMQLSYGIESDFKLVVTATSQGRWVSGSSSETGTSVISLIQEFQLGTFSVDDPASHINCDRFKKQLDDLPPTYDKATAPLFRSFFSMWGTHLVYEQSVGGIIQLDCCVQKTKMTAESLREISSKASGVFNSIITGAKSGAESEMNHLRESGVSNEQLQIEGGQPPELITMNTINSDEIKRWAKTVPRQPIELRHTLKLFPFYNLLNSGEKYEAFRQATKEYMDGTMETTIQGKTRDEAAAEAIRNAEAASARAGCFPNGTMVSLTSNRFKRIEDLNQTNENEIVTQSLIFTSGKGYKLGMKTKHTHFVTFLHKNVTESMAYLVLEFSNGKSLTVSSKHLIYKYAQSHQAVIPVQAKYLQVGEQMVFRNTAGGVEYPHLVSISEKICQGIICPLTDTGTFFADGFLVTSYAHVKSFMAAEMAMIPLKLSSKLKMLSPKTPNKNYVKEADKDGEVHPYAKKLMLLKKVCRVK